MCTSKTQTQVSRPRAGGDCIPPESPVLSGAGGVRSLSLLALVLLWCVKVNFDQGLLF